MPRRDRPLADYSVPETRRLRRGCCWRLRRMRDAVDVETLEVFEHELSAFERAGVAELERQRTRNVAAAAARVAEAQTARGADPRRARSAPTPRSAAPTSRRRATGRQARSGTIPSFTTTRDG